jgi:hypothetical protein
MKTCSSLEALETRIAPATLLSSSAFSYTDIDGDTVKVTFSKAILETNGSNFDTLVTITGGLAGTGFQDLIRLNLSGLGLTANGLGIKVVATPSKQFGGDGMVSGLEIEASEVDTNGVGDGIDLGVVSIDGDINWIDAGDSDDATLSIKSLTVKSVGLNTAGVGSDIYGPMGTIKVTGNFAGFINVNADNIAVPHIKSITIGGSIFGNLEAGSGRIYAFGSIGPVKVGGDVVGGDGELSGSILSDSSIGNVTIKGTLSGGDGDDSGIISGFSLGTVKLGGSLKGGNGPRTGVIEAYSGDIKSLTISGSVYGGPGNNSGVIQAASFFAASDGNGSVGTVLIKGSVIGFVPDSGEHSAGVAIRADDSIRKVTILGALVNANIVAGVQPGADLEYGTDDDIPTAGAPGANRSLGPVVIKSGVSATEIGFAITALNIASIQAGGPVLKPGGPLADFTTGFVLGGGTGLFVVEI